MTVKLNNVEFETTLRVFGGAIVVPAIVNIQEDSSVTVVFTEPKFARDVFDRALKKGNGSLDGLTVGLSVVRSEIDV